MEKFPDYRRDVVTDNRLCTMFTVYGFCWEHGLLVPAFGAGGPGFKLAAGPPHKHALAGLILYLG